MSLIVDRREQLAVLGSNIIQISKLVKFSRPEIFEPHYMSDCSDEHNIGCPWSKCKSSWNKNTDKSFEDCFEVIPIANYHLTSVSTCISESPRLCFHRLSCIIHVPWSRHSSPQRYSPHPSDHAFFVPFTPEIRIYICIIVIRRDYVRK